MNHRLRVALQGELGSFSSVAAYQLLGEGIELVPCETFDQMFAAVEQGACQRCLAPIENSLYGAVFQNYDLLLRQNLRIVGEINLRIVHNLIAPSGTSFEDLQTVYSHPVALGQCLKFFAAHPQLKAVSAYDTAGSVKQIMASREPHAAAIASVAAAEAYGAEIIRSGIEDDQQNFTRFLLLAHADDTSEPTPAANKTSIVFTLEHRTGALHKAMAAFALRDIDLMKVESRPLVGRPFEYNFYLDFMGNLAEPRVINALRHLDEFATNVKVLGCYVSAVTIAEGA
jgi:prephenate dehydratase